MGRDAVRHVIRQEHLSVHPHQFPHRPDLEQKSGLSPVFIHEQKLPEKLIFEQSPRAILKQN
jgi:hypothetical protein